MRAGLVARRLAMPVRLPTRSGQNCASSPLRRTFSAKSRVVTSASAFSLAASATQPLRNLPSPEKSVLPLPPWFINREDAGAGDITTALQALSPNMLRLTRPKRSLWRRVFRLAQLLVLFAPALALLPFAYVLATLERVLRRFFRLKTRLRRTNQHARRRATTEAVAWRLWWGLFRKAIELSGPCPIKLGQWAATRADLFPLGLTSELSKLHAQAPSHSWRHTRRVLLACCGAPEDTNGTGVATNTGAVAEVENADDRGTAKKRTSEGLPPAFAWFEREPTASGAMGQVHRAKLADSLGGAEVAVKVRHPNVEQSVWTDLDILRDIAALAERLFPALRFMALADSVAQFTDTMVCQLDFRLETKHLLRFRHNFRADAPAQASGESHAVHVTFPEPFVNFANPELLVESFEAGTSMGDWLKPGVSAVDKKRLGAVGLDAYLQMMLIDHYIHADLHPGNMLVRRGSPTAGNEPSPVDTPMDIPLEVVVLDVGLVTELSPVDAEHFVALFKAVVQGSGEEATRLMIKHAKEEAQFEDEEDQLAFERDVGAVFRSVSEHPLGELDVGSMLAEIMEQFQRHHVLLEGNFATLMLGTMVLEGLGRQLDPDINLITASIPFLFRNVPRHMVPRSIRETMRDLKAARRLAETVVRPKHS